MNYDQARKRDDGVWHWTTMNDGIVHVAAPCTDACTHATQEEAERHFYGWCMDSISISHTSDEQHKCAVCGMWTINIVVAGRYLSQLSYDTYLCNAHANKESMMHLHPFHAGIQVIHS